MTVCRAALIIAIGRRGNMLEKFTDEEIEQIRRELDARDAKSADRDKPGRYYRNRIYKMFEDRPFKYHNKGNMTDIDLAVYVSRAIDNLVALTLDCTRITDDVKDYPTAWNGPKTIHALRTRKLSMVPHEVADEYYEMFEEILDLMDKHLKPYKRFLEEGEQ